MKKLVRILCMTLCLAGLFACTTESKTAMVDVNAIITNGPHAQSAATYLQEAQQIYQYNLDIIRVKLATYKNIPQANAYFAEASRQLQTQMNNSRVLMTQALAKAFETVLEGQKQAYDLIIKKDGILYIEEGQGAIASKFKAMPEDITTKMQILYNNAAITLPPLPKKIDDPELPADLGEGVPFPPKKDSE